jgi:hypothetical protein
VVPQVALERRQARMVSQATAVTRVWVGRVVAVQPVRMGRLYLQTVRPAVPVALAAQEA